VVHRNSLLRHAKEAVRRRAGHGSALTALARRVAATMWRAEARDKRSSAPCTDDVRAVAISREAACSLA
jgi:hypothetical protein